MLRNWLALVGVLLILAAVVFGLAWAQYRVATDGSVPDSEGLGFSLLSRSIAEVTPNRAFVWSLVALLLGVSLTIPWWRQRLRQEEAWWQERDERLKGPPRAGV